MDQATNPMSGSGEIPLLDADRLDDHAGVAIDGNDGSSDFGDCDDTRAINRLISRLRRAPSSRSLSDEQIENKAIELYRRSCALIESGRASDEQIDKTAGLFGESADHLRKRLGLDETDDEGGAEGLLAALRSA